MKRDRLLLLLFLLLSIPSNGAANTTADSVVVTFDTLGGDLPPIVLARQRPYVVISDIYVPQGRRVSIEAGCVFLFRGFTGLQVMGTLEAKGTADRPVVFTSVNDRTYNPGAAVDAAPYDWNGIYLHEDALGTVLNHCRILYSVDGISATTKFFRLTSGVFLNNGRASLTIEGVAHPVADTPYDYALTKADPVLQGVPLAILRDPLARKRNGFRYSGLSLAVGGTALGIMYALQLHDSAERLRDLSSTDPINLSAHSSSDWKSARSDRRVDGFITAVGWGAAAVGAAGLGFSFSF